MSATSRLTRAPWVLLILALALTLAWRLTAALGWDAALDVLTGVHTSTDRGAVWRSVIHAGATMGTFVFAPILAGAGASWLVVRRLFERRDRRTSSVRRQDRSADCERALTRTTSHFVRVK